MPDSKQFELHTLPYRVTAIQNARMKYEALPDIGVDKRHAIFEWFLKVDEPAMVDLEKISHRFGLEPGVALTLLNYVLTDPRVSVELRDKRYNDEGLPDRVPVDSDQCPRESRSRSAGRAWTRVE